MEQLQHHIWLTASSHIWLNICAFPHIWLCNCSILNFLIYEEKWFFYHCSIWPTMPDTGLCTVHTRKSRYQHTTFIPHILKENPEMCFLGKEFLIYFLDQALHYSTLKFKLAHYVSLPSWPCCCIPLLHGELYPVQQKPLPSPLELSSLDSSALLCWHLWPVLASPQLKWWLVWFWSRLEHALLQDLPQDSTLKGMAPDQTVRGGENHCSIWSRNLLSQVPKFSVINLCRPHRNGRYEDWKRASSVRRICI